MCFGKKKRQRPSTTGERQFAGTFVQKSAKQRDESEKKGRSHNSRAQKKKEARGCKGLRLQVTRMKNHDSMQVGQDEINGLVGRLPVEILCVVLSHLPREYDFMARLACRLWCQLVQHIRPRRQHCVHGLQREYTVWASTVAEIVRARPHLFTQPSDLFVWCTDLGASDLGAILMAVASCYTDSIRHAVKEVAPTLSSVDRDALIAQVGGVALRTRSRETLVLVLSLVGPSVVGCHAKQMVAVAIAADDADMAVLLVCSGALTRPRAVPTCTRYDRDDCVNGEHTLLDDVWLQCVDRESMAVLRRLLVMTHARQSDPIASDVWCSWMRQQRGCIMRAALHRRTHVEHVLCHYIDTEAARALVEDLCQQGRPDLVEWAIDVMGTRLVPPE